MMGVVEGQDEREREQGSSLLPERHRSRFRGRTAMDGVVELEVGEAAAAGCKRVVDAGEKDGRNQEGVVVGGSTSDDDSG
jgi:hypothetical protein